MKLLMLVILLLFSIDCNALIEAEAIWTTTIIHVLGSCVIHYKRFDLPLHLYPKNKGGGGGGGYFSILVIDRADNC